MSYRGTVLVVGRTEAWRRAVCDALRPLDCAVSGAETLVECDAFRGVPEAGLHTEAAAAESPLLLIVDARDLDRDALARVKAKPATIIAVTGEAGEIRDEALFDAVVRDPFDLSNLVKLAGTLLKLRLEAQDLRQNTERLQLAQDAADIAVLDWVLATGQFTHSERLLALLDLPPRSAEGVAVQPSEIIARIHPADRDALIEEFAADSRSSERFRTEFRVVTTDGTIRWIASRGRFFLSPDGRPERMLSLNFDVTQRKENERANAELAAIVQSSVDAIFSTDADGLITSWNRGAARLFALEASDVLRRPIDAVLGQLAKDLVEPRRAAMASGNGQEIELRRTAENGTVADLSITTAPVQTPDGDTIGTSFIIRDISAQKAREDHIRFLMRELTHRSKNLLAVIQAMARQSMTQGVSPLDFVTRFSERLAGLAGSHDLLSTVQWQGASLIELIRSQLRHYEDLFGTRIMLSDKDVLIRPEAAQNIGIALHELSTNAAKYGALSNDDGTVTLAWSLERPLSSEELFVLRWVERGGPPVLAPTRKGFGHVVMERITGRALAGASGLSFLPEGLEWTLSVPRSAVLFEAVDDKARQFGE